MAGEGTKSGGGGGWRLIAGLMFLVSIGLLVAVIVMAITLNARQTQQSTPVVDNGASDQVTQETPMCGPMSESNVDVSEAEYPGLFDDLTVKELKAVQEYMYGLDMNIAKPSESQTSNSYIFISDLMPPNKSDAVAYLSGSGPKPDRQARLVVFRGDIDPPMVEEYIVGPLPNPSYHMLYFNPSRKNPVSFSYRPFGLVQTISYYYSLFSEIDNKIGHILMESYGGTFTKCENCLTFFPVAVGTGVLNSGTRKFWFIANRYIEYSSIHALDLLLLVNCDSPDPFNYTLEKIVYAGQEYSSLDDLALQYNASSIPKTTAPWPDNTRDLFSTLNRRGEPVPKHPKRAPRLFEPDGKRYTVKHRSVEYMQWKFDFRLSPLRGPQLYDIQFNNERIAYEIGMQEIAVFYAGNNSASRHADFLDSSVLLGSNSFSLVPGADCPETSTFIDVPFIGESGSNDPVVRKRAFCLFELNSGVPLRRHLTGGDFYSGMSDNVLILRSAMAIANYDYLVDFIFHQSGAMDVRVMSTGYIMGTYYTDEERPYGFRLHENLLGPIHQHMFLFKVDLDIHGTSNRYETLDISAEEVQNEPTTGDPRSSYYQIKFDRNLKETEMDAVFKYDFDRPMYHVIHNNQVNTKYGEIKAYRLEMAGMFKQLVPANMGNEPVIAWSRQQLSVTKHKEEEREASSCYAMFDSMDPTVNFTAFIADNENIVDEDLVLWVPLGVTHIPHTEDLPITPTPGAHLTFSLLPYNYFPECPSSQSRDSIRVEYKDRAKPQDGVRVLRYETPEEEKCVPPVMDFVKAAENGQMPVL